MTEKPNGKPPGNDGLWRWLLGGLVAGAVVLGLMVGAYAVGYDRGESDAAAPAASAAPAATEPAPTSAVATTAAEGPVEVTPELVAAGEALYTSQACAGCHSLSGEDGAGPSLDGAAGRSVTLDDGTTVTADDAYLYRAIVDPDAEIVDGYSAGIMPAAIAGFDLASKPDDVRALIAFIKSQE